MVVLVPISCASVHVLCLAWAPSFGILLCNNFFYSQRKNVVENLTTCSHMQLVDFEIWKMILSKPGKNSGYISNGGSFLGYADSLEQLNIDVQGNTYAFGVLLLELISGRPWYCKDRGCLVDWVRHPSIYAI